MKRRTWAGAFVGVAAMIPTSVFATSPARAAQPSPGNCVVSATDLAVDSVELDLANLINNYRVQNGRAPLRIQQDLNRSAAWFARDMASKNYFPSDHVDSNGRDIPSRFSWCGVAYNAWRENIAANTTTTNQASTIFNQWVNSPPHQTNMLATDITSMGIARAFDASSMYGYYYVNTFTDSVSLPAADFDGSGNTDIAVYRPGSSASWFVRGQTGALWGTTGDVPVPGDYDGSGTTDMAVFRPGNPAGWYIRGQTGALGGTTGDIPVPGDYDGNGTTDIAVFRPGNPAGWYIRGQSGFQWGTTGDIPVPGDYNGDGKTDIAVYRPGNPGGWFIMGQAGAAWGATGDVPVPGDYNGDGTTDIAVYRPGNPAGWFIRGQAGAAWGTTGDIPVPGDYNADGTTDIAVFRPGSAAGWFIKGQAGALWGTTGDIPLPLPPALRTIAGLPV